MSLYPNMRRLVKGEIPDGDVDMYVEETEEQLRRLNVFLDHPASVRTLSEVASMGGARDSIQAILVSLERERRMLLAWLQWFAGREAKSAEAERESSARKFLDAYDAYVSASKAVDSVA